MKLQARVQVEEIEYMLKGFSIKRYCNTKAFELIRRIISYIEPTILEWKDKLWELYMPLKEDRRKIVVPFFIQKVKNVRAYFIFVDDFGSCEIRKGKEKSEEIEILKRSLEDALEFLPLLKRNPKLIEKVPYHFRKGKIKAKHVLERVFPKKEAEKILAQYKENLKKECGPISLNYYLNVAAICYKAVFKEARLLSPEEMYRKWADGRDCDMLKIKKKNSKRAFGYWLSHKAYCGGHPFEILFSWFHHGILLYPPSKYRKRFCLALGNYGMKEVYFKMVKALLENEIPFEAPELEDVILYLTGEKEMDVNTRDIFKSVTVTDEDKELVKLVKWQALKVPKWKFPRK
jgi:hypothetical protein